MTTKQAAAAYLSSHMTALDLLAAIGDRLDNMPAPENVNWSHAADAAEVNRRLRSVLAFLDGTED